MARDGTPAVLAVSVTCGGFVRHVWPHTTAVVQRRCALHRDGLPFMPKHRTQPSLAPPSGGSCTVNTSHGVDRSCFPAKATQQRQLLSGNDGAVVALVVLVVVWTDDLTDEFVPVDAIIQGCQTPRDKSRASAPPDPTLIGAAQPCTCVQGSKNYMSRKAVCFDGIEHGLLPERLQKSVLAVQSCIVQLSRLP